MMRRILVLAVILTTLATALPVTSAAAPSPDRSGRRAELPGADAASVTAFVNQVRADAERNAFRPHSLQESIGRLVPDLPQASRCLTPTLTEASRQAAGSSALARLVAPLYARPALPHEMLFTTTDGIFTIHYTLDRTNGDGVLATDRDESGIPDYIDQVASSLSLSRRKIVGRFGYRDIAGDSPIDVYLTNLGGRVDGYFVRAPGGQAASLVIDSRLLGNDALLRAAVAHQYAHAVLDAYDPGAPLWWAEASASWIEGQVVGSYAHYTEAIQTALDASLGGLALDDARVLQGRLLWPAYLAGAHGQTGIVRQIWETLDLTGDGSDLWQATDQVLRMSGTSLEEAFSDYSLWLLLSGNRSDDRHFPFADRLDGVSYSAELDSYPASEVQSLPPVAPLGAAFVRFLADDDDGGLRLVFDGDQPGQFQVQLLLTPREGSSLVRAIVTLDASGHGTIGIPWATYSEAVLVAGNVARTGTSAPYSFSARRDPTFPFTVSSFMVQPDHGDVRVSWESSAENGLFGWIVYRTEHNGGAPRRVNDLLVPAIGDGDGPVSYQYLDEGVSTGRTYYYRLVGVTHDGLTKEVPETRVDVPK
jgi:hypothetical protein